MLRSDSPRQVNPQQARLLEYRSLIHPATLQQQEPQRSMLVLGTVESCCHQFFPNSVSQWGLQPRIAQVQRGSRESSEGSGEGSRKPWCKAKVSEKVWEALVQSQVRFNRVPEKVPEKVWEALVQSLVRSQVRLNTVPKKVPGGFGAEPGSC